MFGHWAQQFRFFLNALDRERCPLCAVADLVESDEIKRIARKPAKQVSICGQHLSRLSAHRKAQLDRVALVRSALGAAMSRQNGLECVICKTAHASGQRLAYAISWLDSRMRFQKALEQAPLFCRVHVVQICRKQAPANFIRIEHRKVLKLINDLAQAQLRRQPELETLIGRAFAYLATVPASIETHDSSKERPGDLAQVPPEDELREFAGWDAERQLEYLGKLESAVASLRYRNGVLAEENRALKTARIAQESIKRDLERDRAALLAGQKLHGKGT